MIRVLVVCSDFSPTAAGRPCYSGRFSSPPVSSGAGAGASPPRGVSLSFPGRDEQQFQLESDQIQRKERVSCFLLSLCDRVLA